MTIILGVDGGGSKTHAVVVDAEGNRLGEGLAGCGNHQISGVDIAVANLRQAVEGALRQAHLEPTDVDFVQYGLAGADRDRDFQILRPALAALPFRTWDVVCDTLAGLRNGSPDYVGVVLVCGSATNAMGRNRLQTVQTGGFGALFGDAAGGAYLSEQTFRSAVRSWDYRDVPSILPDAVARHLGFPAMEPLLAYYLDHDIRTVPLSLTLVLHEAAEARDELAIRILRDTGHELGLAANSVVRRLGGFEGERFPVVLVGSILQKGRSPYLLRTLQETVRRENPDADFVLPQMAPVYGAVLLGMDCLGVPVTEHITAKFASYGGHEG
ncbi:N-acetylglucosamine kinase [Alicyclobacillus cycloheptanicus]|uniref:N-acetylglucosamine kinase-like BadF-type ATPase n=1 Tax=Alicyclobacillus cycloheptanicus TaxID=1457 RepID=A0ABT9XJ17_9BACL|nr:BadF/BadG/BcrA/BcrD ATPase family protein [Alicyclobacillus cycloheptanicus]MDQ0190275.1 N-acetylglucosamine kinase-like BadF-type ATPase [Alicyclobacillus cycloheptanicus]